MWYRVYILSFFFCLCGDLVVCAEEDWFSGSVVLKSRARLQGEIAFRPCYEVVLFKRGQEIMAYPAHRILSVKIYDKERDTFRDFVSFRVSSGAATEFRLYEVLVSGRVNILKKEHVVWRSPHVESVECDYFIQKDDQLISIRKFRRKVLPWLVLYSDVDLQDYIRKNRLSLLHLSDIIQVVRYFNESQLSDNRLATTK